ncbi:hypothetical protein BZA05DRAFT_421210 [Tricharina praecox]|uniref:uncharacterized protein n=1 Tax=Tricharina praecox TaxID=43433 RepID=UPI00221FF85C|nr:uncharacterized protein BZA05DRAFT_421210 [Tricharina praecox]KAI5845962.1 hypothetical protein BZA05DRAFT_421210 [Tricharina praecox]
MTVPPTINNTKGAMADFAAQITCLFWFESTGAIHRIAELKTPLDPSSIQPIARHAVPEIGFRKWVATVLSTTQVSQNVILLALLFVYRLKKLNPSVQGKPGSEFRLFTVALMLGNKYLDDNTYTNKTWAEVSGITVGDIHVMEVEFLSNMRYGLYVGDQEWKDWHTNLGKYWDYWDKASRLPLASPPQPQPMSPTSNGGSPAFAHLHAPPPPLQPTAIAGHQLFLPAPVALDPPHVPSISMPIPDFDSFSRKRSIDYASVMQPPSKRVTRSQVPKLSVNVPQFPVSVPTTMPPGSAPPRLQPLDYQLPLPSNRGAPPRTMDTHPVQLQQHPLQIQQQQQHHSIQLPQQQQQQQQQQQHPQLPLPSARPMPVVSHSSPSASGPPVHFDFSPYSARQTSPYSAQHSVASSPITPNFSSQRSPTCWILGNRHSPYRPVRTVNTLLVPPHLEAPQQIGYDQMHYQPLAKVRSEYKTGVVPYMQPEVSWNHSWSDNNHY